MGGEGEREKDKKNRKKGWSGKNLAIFSFYPSFFYRVLPNAAASVIRCGAL